MEPLESRLRAAGCVFPAAEARILTAAAESPDQLREFADRRVSGVPLEHIVGYADFAGHRIAVEPGVFVPRRRSELLVAQAIPLVRRGDVVVDLCCGSGAIATAIAAAVPGAEVHATDVDPIATSCAQRNLATYGGVVHTGDLVAPLPARLRGRVAVMTANAPYVPTAEIALMPAEARDHEPTVALDGGADGVDVHRRIAATAPGWLAAHGAVLIETSARQAERTAQACRTSGLDPRIVTDDDLAATVVVATKPATTRQP